MNILARLGILLIRIGGPKEKEALYRRLEVELGIAPSPDEPPKTYEELQTAIAFLETERADLRHRLDSTSAELDRHAHRSAERDLIAADRDNLRARLAAVDRTDKFPNLPAELVGAARIAAEAADQLPNSGERKRAAVYRQMLRDFPDSPKRQIAGAIETALGGL